MRDGHAHVDSMPAAAAADVVLQVLVAHEHLAPPPLGGSLLDHRPKADVRADVRIADVRAATNSDVRATKFETITRMRPWECRAPQAGGVPGGGRPGGGLGRALDSSGLATSSPLGPPPPVQSPSRSFGLATSSPPVQSPSNARRGLHGAPTMLHAPQPHSPSRSPSKRSHITRSMVRSVSLPPIARPIGIAATRGDASERQRGGPWPVAGGTGRPLAAL
jgi:hypothetical protein